MESFRSGRPKKRENRINRVGKDSMIELRKRVLQWDRVPHYFVCFFADP